MKKLLMLGAALVFGLANAGTVTGNVTVNASVVNICTFGNTSTVASGTYSATVTLPGYNALNPATQAMGPLANAIRCTQGTTMSLSDGTTTTSPSATAASLSGSLGLTSPSTTDTLNVNYSVSATMTGNDAQGDHWDVAGNFTAPAGQWNVNAANDYTGTLTLTATWN